MFFSTSEIIFLNSQNPGATFFFSMSGLLIFVEVEDAIWRETVRFVEKDSWEGVTRNSAAICAGMSIIIQGKGMQTKCCPDWTAL